MTQAYEVDQNFELLGTEYCRLILDIHYSA